MQREWDRISTITGAVEIEQEVEKDIDDQLHHFKKLRNVSDHKYRKSLLKSVSEICLWDANKTTDLFYKHNWLAVMEQSLFSDDRIKREQVLAKMGG